METSEPKTLLSSGFFFFVFLCVSVLRVRAVCVGVGVWLSLRVKAVLFDMFDTLMLIERDHAFYSPSLRAAYEFLAANGVSVGFDEFERAYGSLFTRLGRSPSLLRLRRNMLPFR